ncbi:DUF4230 domain-containing protein [Candidatus Dojkabacteria bacterium]|nr:DUF4230 domain-containing protein [Candidatus Dojkabacteria bacterium]
MMKIKQFFLTTIISFLFGFLIGVSAGLVIGIKVTKQSTERQLVSSTVVLDKIKDQSFLVTRTIVTEQSTTINIDQGSAWSNFWWGHEITAEGLMQVDIGVDLGTITEGDIRINNENKVIEINLPDAEIYNTSLEGSIDVSTKSGILKKLFASDDNEDYNLAMSELAKQAEDSINSNEELLSEAKASALSTLQAIFKDTGYSVKILE